MQVYKAQNPSISLRVYNLRYASSLEADKYAAALSREQKAFEDLISHKRHLVLPDLATDLAALSQHPSALSWTGGTLMLTHPGIDDSSGLPGNPSHNSVTRRAGVSLTGASVPAVLRIRR